MVLRLEKRKALKSLSYLWKQNDKEWFENRKAAWKRLQADVFFDSELRDVTEYQEYFLKGKLDAYIPVSTLFFLTPIESQEDSDSVFFSDMFTDEDRQRIITLPYSSEIERAQDGDEFINQYVRSFAKYRLACGTGDVVLNGDVVFTPDDFVKQYVEDSLNIFNGRVSYSAAIDTLDFFMDSLPLLTDKTAVQIYDSRNMLLGIMNEGCEMVLDRESSSSSAKIHAQQLLDRKDEIINIWNALDIS